MAMKCPHILPITKMWMWTNLLNPPFLQHPSYYEMLQATGQQQSKKAFLISNPLLCITYWIAISVLSQTHYCSIST